MSLVVCGIRRVSERHPAFFAGPFALVQITVHGNEYAFDSIVATLGCGRLPLGARAARRTRKC